MEASLWPVEVAEQLEQSNKQLAVINALLQLSLQDLPLRDILLKTLDLLTQIPWISRQSKGAIFLAEDEPEVLQMQAQRGLDGLILEACQRVPFGCRLCGRAAATRQVQYAAGLDIPHRVDYEGMAPHGHYCIPIRLGERLLGVMNLYIPPDRPRLTQDEEFLSSVAHALAGIIVRQEADEGQRRSEQKFSLLLRNVPAIVFKGYTDGSVEVFDDKIAEFTGFSESDFASKRLKWTDLILPEDLDQVRAEFIQALRGPRSYVREYRLKRRDGQVIWVQERSHIVHDQHGRIDYISGVLFDITKRKSGEEALKKSVTQLRDILRGTVMALVSAVEMRDPYTAGHLRRVTQLACAIAQELGFTEEQIEGMRMIGFLHDIGKIAVPAEILTKPGRISDSEFLLIKRHVEAGFDILKEIKFPCPVAEAIAQHHERLDGSGYPKGLIGRQIVIQARILAVADVVEAMATHRPYRPALGIDQALQEVIAKKGILYDPVVVDVCVRLFKEKGFVFD